MNRINRESDRPDWAITDQEIAEATAKMLPHERFAAETTEACFHFGDVSVPVVMMVGRNDDGTVEIMKLKRTTGEG